MRTPIELALSLRSYERVVCLTDPSTPRDTYPEHWELPQTIRGSTIDVHCVVVVDRIDISGKALAAAASRNPRLIAFAVASVDHERATRRLLKSLYPFAETWDVSTDLAKLVLTDAHGDPYDRDRIIDQRPVECA